ncbi:hypothetical protein DYB28_002699 [Aphanomyces astaci]|uniref:Uncharacterized protein n=1 Tax=Aphanomyces astaci TaxID=112090 RepID=A0A9X8DTZ7_APHAT|nr:hypothetical protein DYB28_002699 [Aphanomyces astaci]
MTWDKAMRTASCTTPALPDPPSFNGSTKSGRRIFIRLYNKYLDQVNTLKLKGSSPFVIPVSTRRDVLTKKRVAMWDMANRDYRGVTNTEWAAWFSKAFEEEPQDLEVLKKRLTTAIRFDTTILDADSQIGKMLDNLMQALERDDEAPKYERKKGTCLKCGSENHKVVNCPKCTASESERLLKEQMDKWESARNKKVTKLQGSATKPLDREAKIEGIVSVTTTRLRLKVILPEPFVIQPYGQAPALKVDRQVQFKLVMLDTPCGPLALRGLKAWVDSSSNAAELLISRAVMERLGFSDVELLSHAFANQEVWDVSDLHAAEDGGLTADLLEKLRLLLAKHGDVLWLEIGHDERIKVEPLRVRIKPGAVPVKCGLRRYPPAHVEFLKTHVHELEAAGLRKLNQSLEGCHVRPVTSYGVSHNNVLTGIHVLD